MDISLFMSGEQLECGFKAHDLELHGWQLFIFKTNFKCVYLGKGNFKEYSLV